MTWKVIATVILFGIAFIALTFFAFAEYGGKLGRLQDAFGSSAPAQAEKLVVAPQEARTSVIVGSATLTHGGFLVVRGGDGTRIGQVIEISRYLAAREHENIAIELGDFYEYDTDDQLVVMVYRDDGDTTFNELDEPVNSTAVFVETGEGVPPAVFEDQVAPADGMGMVTVRYTTTGFQPAQLTVPIGTMVEFVNQSKTAMWVASNVHPEHEILPTFDQFKEVPKGQSYMYTFDTKGSWAYHDHINPSFEGVITVE